MNIKARIGDNPNLIEVDFSSLRWNKSAQRYISPRGKFIDPSAVRDVIDRDIKATQKRMRVLSGNLRDAANDYQNGVVTKAQYRQQLEKFHREMRRELKNLHLANAMAAKGGIASMDQVAYGQAGAQLRYHYGKLDDFVKELRDNPKIATSEARGKMDFERRTELYAEVGRFTYEIVREKSHIAAGFKYVENVLEPNAQHCHTHNEKEGCLEQTAKGRVPIGEIVMIGKRYCGPADKCKLKYYKYQRRKRA